MASVTDPNTWGTFDDAVQTYKNGKGYSGIGLVLTKEDPICGIDIDSCIDVLGDIHPAALDVVTQLNSYTEMSPSGQGLRIFTIANINGSGRRKGKFEIYTDGRFLTVTGHKLIDAPTVIEERNAEVALFHKKYISKPVSAAANRETAAALDISVSDTEILDKARRAKNGNLFSLLFDQGDWQKVGYSSQSEADQALANILAFWCGKDVGRIETFFRQSALYREKCDKPHFSGGETYLQHTVQEAVNGTQKVYQPKKKGNNKVVEFKPQNTESKANQQKAIQINNRFLPSLTKDALDALMTANNPPELFIRDGEIVKVVRIEDKDKLNQSFTRPVIKLVNEASLRGYLARSAQYVRAREKDGEVTYSPATPPLDMVRDVMARDDLPLPLLRGIIQVPIMRWDGSMFEKPGYDTVTSLFYIPDRGFKMPNIPQKPNWSDIKNSIEKLQDIVVDFPFDSNASRTNIIAAIMTPVLRDLVAGPVPMLLIDKPLQGTGASLLSDVISIISTGRNSHMTTAPDGREREEEWRKRVTSVLLDGRPVVVIDNVEDVFRSATLCALLTSTNWSDRILGRSELISLQHRTCWLATGNNIRLAGDLPRRCYKVRMDANMSKPWQRNQKEFRHPHLLKYIKDNRGALLAAIYTLARAWINAGRPGPGDVPPMGSFEDWRETIGGILEFAGVNGFLENSAEIYENAEVNDGIEGIIEALYQEVGESLLSTKQIQHLVTYDIKFQDALPDWLDPGDRGFTRKLGRVLAKKAGVIFTNGYKLEKCGTQQRAQLWKITSIK